MGKASSTKKVARAARAGGGVRRRRGGGTSYGYPTLLTTIVVAGVALVAFSRNQQHAAAAVHPSGKDHWHAAYAIDICGTIEPNLPQNPNLNAPVGLHTHGDGLIHIEPYFSNLPDDAGKNATLARFIQSYPGVVVTSTVLKYPGQASHKNGDQCAGKPAQVQIRVWPNFAGSSSTTSTDPKTILLRNGQAITIAFVPAGTDIPKPPQANINALRQNMGLGPATSTTAAASSSTTSPSSATTSVGSATTSASSATTTAAGSSSTSPAATSAPTTSPPSTSPPTTR